jgi:hypothetical protein
MRMSYVWQQAFLKSWKIKLEPNLAKDQYAVMCCVLIAFVCLIMVLGILSDERK